MRGYIYIAGSFETVNRSACGQRGSWIDNDPHYWTDPPTWGICRNDLRATANEGDVVFFVLPKNGRHPQMIFGYLTIEKIVTHHQAFFARRLRSKRMGNKMPNGNIIVDASGRYNRFDAGAHQHIFHKIKDRYAIGDPAQSRMLTYAEISKSASSFTAALARIVGKSGQRAIDIISRKGTILSPNQVNELLAWVNRP